MLAQSTSEAPIRLFCSYADEDREYYKELKKHLAASTRTNKFILWDKDLILPGSDRDKALDDHFTKADVVILLLSSGFTSCDLCWELMALAEPRVGTSLLPVLLRHVDLADAYVSRLTLVPKDPPLPVSECPDQDKAWKKIVDEIRHLSLGLRSNGPSPPDQPTAVSVNDRVAYGIAQNRHELGQKLIYTGQLEIALKHLRDARDDFEEMIQQDQENSVLTRNLAKLHDRIGHVMYKQGKLEEAREAFDRAFGFRSTLLAKAPEDRDVLRDICASRYWRGHLSFIQGDLLRARDEQRGGCLVCEKLLGSQPDDPKVSRDLLVLRTDLATTLRELGGSADAERHLREALSLARSLGERQPFNLQFRRDLAVGLFRLAGVLVANGQAAQASDYCEESVQVCRELVDKDGKNVQWRHHLATAHIELGDVRSSQGNIEAAQAEYQSAADILTDPAGAGGDDIQWLHARAALDRKLARLALRRGDVTVARAAYQRATGALSKAIGGAGNKRWLLELLDLYMDALEASKAAPDADLAGAGETRGKAVKLMDELTQDDALHLWAKQTLATIRDRARLLGL